jgi:hypothetical protein
MKAASPCGAASPLRDGKPLSGRKKRATLCGILGFGITLREAREDALDQVETTLDQLRKDAAPKIVMWCGFVGIVYRNVGGVNYAIIGNPVNGIRPGRIQASALCAPETSMENAERALRQYLAQTAWSPGAGTDPPEILEDERDQGEFRAWAEWQTAYANATQNGASDEEARRIADE